MDLLCGNPPVVGSPHKGPLMQSLDVSLLVACVVNKQLNSQVAGDLKHHDAQVTTL